MFWLVGFRENGPQEKNLGNCRGSFTATKRPLAAAKDPHVAARPRGKVGPASGSPGAKPLFTAWKCCVFVLFCFFVVPKTCLLDK